MNITHCSDAAVTSLDLVLSTSTLPSKSYWSCSWPYQMVCSAPHYFEMRVVMQPKNNREKKSTTQSKCRVITAKYLGQRCHWSLDQVPRVSPSSPGSMRKLCSPLGVNSIWAWLQTPAPGLAGSLGNSYLREAHWRNCKLPTLRPDRLLGFVQHEATVHTDTHSHYECVGCMSVKVWTYGDFTV